MQRTYTRVGSKYTETKQQRKAIEQAIDNMVWLDIKAHPKAAMMPALAIASAIRQLKLYGVSHYSVSNELPPYEFYGIRANYTNGIAQIYLLDTGTKIIPLATDFRETGTHTPAHKGVTVNA